MRVDCRDDAIRSLYYEQNGALKYEEQKKQLFVTGERRAASSVFNSKHSRGDCKPVDCGAPIVGKQRSRVAAHVYKRHLSEHVVCRSQRLGHRKQWSQGAIVGERALVRHVALDDRD